MALTKESLIRFKDLILKILFILKDPYQMLLPIQINFQGIEEIINTSNLQISISEDLFLLEAKVLTQMLILAKHLKKMTTSTWKIN